MSRADALEALAILTAAYDRDMPEETARIYLAALVDIERDVLLRAATTVITESTFFPSVAEILTAAIDDQCGWLTQSPQEAWGEVIAVIQSIGRAGRPEWADPLTIEAVAAVGGYRHLCDSELIAAERSHFVKAYEAARRRQRRAALSAAQASSLPRSLESPGNEPSGESNAAP
jgi:hypothetical protein